MAVIAFLAAVDKRLGVALPIERLAACEKVGDLLDLLGDHARE